MQKHNDGRFATIGFAFYAHNAVKSSESQEVKEHEPSDSLCVRLGLLKLLELQRCQLLSTAQLKSVCSSWLTEKDYGRRFADNEVTLSRIGNMDDQVLVWSR